MGIYLNPVEGDAVMGTLSKMSTHGLVIFSWRTSPRAARVRDKNRQSPSIPKVSNPFYFIFLGVATLPPTSWFKYHHLS